MSVSLALRQRAGSAGVLEALERVAAGERRAEDLLALASGPLSLLASAASERTAPAAIVGVLPVRVSADVDAAIAAALSHRAAAEAEVIELSALAPAPVGALDLACEVARRLLAELPGAVVRIDGPSLLAMAEGANVELDAAAARLRTAGATSVLDDVDRGPLAAVRCIDVPAALDADFVSALASARGPLILRAAPRATGIALLRGVALAHVLGLSPITLRASDELKGPDAALAFGADALEAELDPPGTLGARTRAYGESAIRGAQRELAPPRRRAPEGKRVPRILDEHVPAGLDGAVTLTVVPSEEIRP